MFALQSTLNNRESYTEALSSDEREVGERAQRRDDALKGSVTIHVHLFGKRQEVNPAPPGNTRTFTTYTTHIFKSSQRLRLKL